MSEAPQSTRPKWLAIVIYSLLRLVILLVVWFIIDWLTPVKGLWALALALLVSGAISLFVLDRQRDAMSMGVAGFFTRINDRIDASARAEDVDPAEASFAAGAGAATASASEHREAGADDQAVGEQQDPGALQGGDQ